MQLIMDDKPTADIKDKMSTFEESLDSKLKDSIDNVSNEIVNGNKENIESQKNIIENATVAVNGDDRKFTDDSSDIQITEIDKILDKLENNSEDTETGDDQLIGESSSGMYVSAKDRTKQFKEEETPLLEGQKNNSISEDVNDACGAKDNTILKETITADNTLKINQEDQCAIVLDDIEIVEEDVPNTSLSNKEDTHSTKSNPAIDIVEKTIVDTDYVMSATEDEILEDCNLDTVPVKMVTDKIVLEDSSIHVELFTVSKENVNDIRAKEHLRNVVEIVDTKRDKNNGGTENETLTDIDVADTTKNTIRHKTEEDNATNETVQTDLMTINTEIKEDTANEALTENLVTKLKQSKENEEPDLVSDSLNPENGDNNTQHEDETKNISSNTPDKRNETISENCDVVADRELFHEEIKDGEDILDIDEFLEGTDVLAEEMEEQPNQDVEKPVKEKEQLGDEIKQPVKANEKPVEEIEKPVEKIVEQVQTVAQKKAPICRLSNTLDILSDDDEEPPQTETQNNVANATTTDVSTDKQCISIEDDDDIMLIDEDTDTKDSKSKPIETTETQENKEVNIEVDAKTQNSTDDTNNTKIAESVPDVTVPDVKDSAIPEIDTVSTTEEENCKHKSEEIQEEKPGVHKKPLLAENFLKGYKKNLADMTREELEEFCILNIVEGIVDRSNLGDIKSKIKTMAQNIDEYKKKAMMLTKQNRDLQLVLKSVQEEQKKCSHSTIVPLRITRSVGMQVLMTEKPNMKKRGVTNIPVNVNNSTNNKVSNNRNPIQSPRPQKTATSNQQQIPVPRLVPAATNPAVKAPNVISQTNSNANIPKSTGQSPINGIKATSPVQKSAEKRPFNRMQSVTVDLTDDEPPTKVTPRSSPAPPVRLVSPQNLLTRPQFAQSLNSPRKVYIPISGPQGQNIRPGQTIMLKSVPPPGQRMRGPAPQAARMPQNQVRLTRLPNSRHPAPLPECMKQYQPPNWKALPPAPDLKLSKVENGIVISWKIEGYQEDSYEEIASYQLYAYQETSSPPSTSLWKKIGDVKALPLPMACTLTQFMAGFKYYFAVRAVDVRSRLGPFSLPGSILLLNKM